MQRNLDPNRNLEFRNKVLQSLAFRIYDIHLDKRAVLTLTKVVSWDALCDFQEGLEVRGFGALIGFCRHPEDEIRGSVGTGSIQMRAVGIQFSMVHFY